MQLRNRTEQKQKHNLEKLVESAKNYCWTSHIELSMFISPHQASLVSRHHVQLIIHSRTMLRGDWSCQVSVSGALLSAARKARSRQICQSKLRSRRINFKLWSSWAPFLNRSHQNVLFWWKINANRYITLVLFVLLERFFWNLNDLFKTLFVFI